MTTRTDLSRRRLLQSALIASVLASLPLGAPTAAFADGTDPFVVARRRWREFLAGADLDRTDPAVARQLASIETAARSAMSTYLTAADRSGLWSDLLLQPRATNADSARVTNTARRLRSIATAHAAGVLGSDAPQALSIVTDGLTWLNQGVYAATAVRYGNWYDWDVAIPQALNDVLVLTYDDVPADLRNSVIAASRAISPSIPQTGTQAAAANRVLFCDSFNGRGILGGNLDEVLAARDGILPTLAYAQPFGGPVGLVDGNKDEAAFFSNDGFYPDGSFIQHGQFAYVGGYGASFLSAVTRVAARTAGSDWCPDLGIVVDWMREAFEPWLWRGLVMDAVRGRQLAAVAGDKGSGLGFIAGMIDLLASTTGAARDHLRSVVKEELGWRGTDPTTGLGLPQTAAAVTLLEDGSVTPRGPLTGTWVFGPMDRVLHRRPAWAVAFTMHSLRMADYETGSNENLRGWYTSDAATYLYDGDLDQYGEGYWCTIDSRRIPGTTVDTVAREAKAVAWRAEYHNPSFWAGGVTAGSWGAATLDLTAKSPSTLRARLSRFFFEDSYVCLGAGISVADGRTAETIVENRRITATTTGPLVVDGSTIIGAGQSSTLGSVGWAHVGGTGGYVLLQKETVLALREQRQGKLSDISGAVTGTTASTVRTGEYLTLAIQHGTGITDGSYAYVVLPGADAAATTSYAAQPAVRVVDRSPAAQAVRQEPTGRFAAALFEAGSSSIVRADAPCTVAVEEGPEVLTIHVSDPSQTATTVTIELDVAATALVSADPRMDLTIAPSRTTLRVDLAGLTGASVSAAVTWRAPKGGDLAAALGHLVGDELQGREGAQLQRLVGQYLDALEAGDRALALARLRAFQARLDAWLQRHPNVAPVIALADLASRLVARTQA